MKSLFNWLQVVAWIVLIFSLSGDAFSSSRTLIALEWWAQLLRWDMPSSTLLLLNFIIRKTAHFGEFFVLGVLLYRAMTGGLRQFRLRAAFGVAAIGLLCAMGDEVRQLSLGSRSASPIDSALDFTGILASQVWIAFRSWNAQTRKATEAEKTLLESK